MVFMYGISPELIQKNMENIIEFAYESSLVYNYTVKSNEKTPKES